MIICVLACRNQWLERPISTPYSWPLALDSLFGFVPVLFFLLLLVHLLYLWSRVAPVCFLRLSFCQCFFLAFCRTLSLTLSLRLHFGWKFLLGPSVRLWWAWTLFCLDSLSLSSCNLIHDQHNAFNLNHSFGVRVNGTFFSSSFSSRWLERDWAEKSWLKKNSSCALFVSFLTFVRKLTRLKLIAMSTQLVRLSFRH